MSAAGSGQLTAAAILAAKRIMRLGEMPRACLCCGREAPLARIVIHKTGAVGLTEGPGVELVAGVCTECLEATSPEREAEIAELARTAARVDAFLALIRRRARAELASWWGGIGACTSEEIDQASVTLRRALERMGMR